MRAHLVISVAVFVVFSCSFAPAQTKPTEPSLSTIDGVLQDFYRSLTFPEGKEPDWERFRNLFGSATSPCVRVTDDAVLTMDRESFITYFSNRIKNGTLKSFEEHEIARTGAGFAGIAQVFSTYEKRMNIADGSKPIRGINTFSVYFKDGRWWIASVLWQDESAKASIPEKYIR